MEERKQMPAGMRYGESVFDLGYLVFDLVAGILFLLHGKYNEIFYLYACLSFILGGGDAFHLLPRVCMHIKGKNKRIETWLGIGMAITSITMTVFYLILFQIYKQLFPTIHVSKTMAIALYVFAIVRILLCLMPQNKWCQGGSLQWGIYRNIPFVFVGLIMIALFGMSGTAFGIKMALAMAFSFAFYLPVTLFSKKKPMVGALMLPKTLMYVWILVMGMQLW